MARAVLVITIIPMVLVSIHPFAVRKIFLLALALLGLSSALCFADPVFMTRQYAPSRDQARPARMAMASRANVEGHSKVLTAFENSTVAHHDLRLVRSLVPFGDMRPNGFCFPDGKQLRLVGSADIVALRH